MKWRTTSMALLLSLSLLLCGGAVAQKKTAVLELVNKAGLTDDEAYYLTDKVRDAASTALANRGFLVITRESLVELLPPGTDLKKCTTASCEVEIGRQIGADYIVTGEILKFAGEYRANLKAHHSQSGAFLGAEAAEGATLKGLERAIAGAAANLFNKVLVHAGGREGDAAGAARPDKERAAGEAPPGIEAKTPRGSVDSRFRTHPGYGPDDAPVQILEFSDFQCPYSAKAAPELRAAVQGFPGLVRVTVVSLPSPGHPFSESAAEFALAAQEHGKFEQAYDALFARQREFAADFFPRLARELSLSESEVADNIANARHRKILKDNFKMAVGDFSVNSTPTLYVNGNAVVGAKTVKFYRDLISEALKTSGSAAPSTFASPSGLSASASGQPVAPRDTAGMVRIPAGAFMMGCSPDDGECGEDEKPAHPVRLGAFLMDATEVTNAQYEECLAAGGCSPVDEKLCHKAVFSAWQALGGIWVGSLDASFKQGRQPVVCVTWEQADGFCRWSGKRLPTEAEWEYAARGGVGGSRYGDIDAIAWYSANSAQKPHPVALKRSNGYGLYDMLGNVAEWTADWFEAGYYAQSPAEHPAGPASGRSHAFRGGSWANEPQYVRAAARGAYGKVLHGLRSNFHGFRCARDE